MEIEIDRNTEVRVDVERRPDLVDTWQLKAQIFKNGKFERMEAIPIDLTNNEDNND